MIKRVIRKFKLSEQPSDRDYWMSKTPEERLDAVEIFRQQYYEMNPDVPKRLQRVYRIISFEDLKKKTTQRLRDQDDLDHL